jgi:hypothetical protein
MDTALFVQSRCAFRLAAGAESQIADRRKRGRRRSLGITNPPKTARSPPHSGQCK